MKTIYDNINLTIALPKEVLEYLVKEGYLNEHTSFSGDTCLKSYFPQETFKKLVESLIIKTKPGIK